MSGLFGGGSSGTDRTNQLQSWADLDKLIAFGQAAGQQNAQSAGNWFQSLLSGNPATVSAQLGPQISTITGQANQQKATNAEFNNRSGGTNATSQAIDSNTRSAIDTLIGNVTSGAANSLASLGLGELGISEGSSSTLAEAAQGARSTDLSQSNLLGSAIGSLLSPLASQGISDLGVLIGL